MKNTETRVQRLNERLNRLQNELDISLTNGNDCDTIIQEIKALEKESLELSQSKKLDRVNKLEAEKRNIIKELLKVEFPIEDINTNDGSLHATKVKKYASLVEFMEKHKYTRFVFENGFYIAANIGGKRYQILKPEYNSSIANYRKFNSIEEAMKQNGIQLKPLTFKKFKSLESRILKESDRIKKEIEKASEKIKSLDVYFLTNNGMINQSQRTHYEYWVSK